MGENEMGEVILGAAMKVHSALGPGLLESAYETCLAHELGKRCLDVKRQVTLPLIYDGVKLDAGYRLDLLINDQIVVELKSVDKFLPIHIAQLLSYLKLSNLRLGYLLNFNVVHMRDGVKRIANGL
ncbi:MAG: GxxExxY protein [Sulfuricella sp.]|nr:GxxExxY protein [Sulfuricella sp.]